MTTRNVSLPEALDAYVEESVQSGRYANASDVVREALPSSELEDEARLRALRAAIADGLKGPFRDGPTVMAEMRERVRLRAKVNRKRTKIA
jgi:antitoxin ParD1/3/4